MSTKQELYNQAINLLKSIDLIVENEKHHKALRKEILDLANNIKRMDGNGNDQ